MRCQEREIDCKSKNSWSRPHWEQNLHFVGDVTRIPAFKIALLKYIKIEDKVNERALTGLLLL
ncbi:hypothetical protein HW555_002696 [Spodoptera exigua]|uniref:Uncharacterized protein n=1 Tax=Spodoptera exigua TaxID=7107 RepID=A0A835GQZ6_SPOEX|nr:hypothetical protein HW555_002696 [Spodoptera exigua]